MSLAPRRVVFDCNTLLQALGSPAGPAGHCVQLAIDGDVLLFLSPFVLSELRAVAVRPKIATKMGISERRLGDFVAALEAVAVMLAAFPETFQLERDPDDAHYVNLAIAAHAELIVTRDRDLLDLMDLTLPGSAEFRLQFHDLRILTPVEFLREVRPTS